jgi:ABC-type transport system involved in cytochrome c biogenesis permease subunit
MLSLAWFIELITLVLYRRFRILLVFGLLLSGFFLLVSHISQMDPQIGRLMPVLRSPLLTIHVGVIMMSFALLSLTFICGLTALLVRCVNKNRLESLTALAVLSKLFLYPALTTLGLGIFIGAIWANVSWGNYWSWDPKEVWALITFMVYAVAVHERSLPWLQKPVSYHLYMTLSFLTILMTYFGVNYFLGGMHSYA